MLHIYLTEFSESNIMWYWLEKPSSGKLAFIAKMKFQRQFQGVLLTWVGVYPEPVSLGLFLVAAHHFPAHRFGRATFTGVIMGVERCPKRN